MIVIMFTYTYLQGGIKRLTQAMNTGKYPTHLQPLVQLHVFALCSTPRGLATSW